MEVGEGEKEDGEDAEEEKLKSSIEPLLSSDVLQLFPVYPY